MVRIPGFGGIAEDITHHPKKKEPPQEPTKEEAEAPDKTKQQEEDAAEECDCSCGCYEEDCNSETECCEDCDCKSCGPMEVELENPGYTYVQIFAKRSDDTPGTIKCNSCGWEFNEEDSSYPIGDAEIQTLMQVHELLETIRKSKSAT